jgi:hypothetical protein
VDPAGIGSFHPDCQLPMIPERGHRAVEVIADERGRPVLRPVAARTSASERPPIARTRSAVADQRCSRYPSGVTDPTREQRAGAAPGFQRLAGASRSSGGSPTTESSGRFDQLTGVRAKR